MGKHSGKPKHFKALKAPYAQPKHASTNCFMCGQPTGNNLCADCLHGTNRLIRDLRMGNRDE